MARATAQFASKYSSQMQRIANKGLILRNKIAISLSPRDTCIHFFDYLVRTRPDNPEQKEVPSKSRYAILQVTEGGVFC